MCFGILRIEVNGLAESRETRVQLILLIVDDAKGKPALLSGGLKLDRFF